MNRETAKDYLPLVQALADGKVIQFHDGVNWVDYSSPAFSHSPASYRIKPDPREFYLVLDNDGTRSYIAYDDESRARGNTGAKERYIHVREVLE